MYNKTLDIEREWKIKYYGFDNFNNMHQWFYCHTTKEKRRERGEEKTNEIGMDDKCGG